MKQSPKLILTIKETERGILCYLLEEHRMSGDYFGNKEQHYKMCKELLEKMCPELLVLSDKY